VLDDAIRDALQRQRPAAELAALSVRSGMRTLRHDGLRTVLDGITTAEELGRVLWSS
jgi:type II secretory ATPase GspE/PulE/Tfp pilus assembly ATPase PilB-like protein